MSDLRFWVVCCFFLMREAFAGFHFLTSSFFIFVVLTNTSLAKSSQRNVDTPAPDSSPGVPALHSLCPRNFSSLLGVYCLPAPPACIWIAVGRLYSPLSRPAKSTASKRVDRRREKDRKNKTPLSFIPRRWLILSSKRMSHLLGFFSAVQKVFLNSSKLCLGSSTCL